MPMFRKKPVVVEAMQFNGFNCYECLVFMGLQDYIVPELSPTDSPVIDTLEGRMTVSMLDWIIRGTKGEYYPCKPDVFADVYEPV